jgi:hypothetical protein
MVPMSEVLERRARSVRARASVRQWEYRQRRHAKGVWVRLTRLLADASHAWEIDEATASRLVAEGCQVESVGLELEPAKTLIVVPGKHSDPSGVGIRPIAVNIGAEFLAARYVALRRFP